MPHAGASPKWESMWTAGIGKGQAFDVGGPSRTLVGALARTKYARNPGMRALVPGCGRAYDAVELARAGFDSVTAIDLSATACEAAREELKAISAASPEFKSLADKVEIVCTDFFTFSGKYDLIWDCTFLCALEPTVREEWATKTKSLLRPDGCLLTCVFPIGKPPGGPPFELTVPHVENLLKPIEFVATEIKEQLPPDERHTPSGAAQFGSAFAAWKMGKAE
jgi:SAM-dependent methyltransferase